ncbi:unnamed protein product [Lymnaea stagnalis]|uniref:Arpin n=1 Tax=Lymnaea stagnalis TaxID=6523 RepID=A0AAV2H363_LYMST
MSRIYDNKPLENLPVQNVHWNGNWDQFQADLIKSPKDNPGVLCEGKIKNQARISITSLSNGSPASKARYYILFLEIETAYRRKFNVSGEEIEPNFNETTKVSTGYLNSSYDVKAKGKTDRLLVDEVKSVIHDSKIEVMIKDILAKSSPGDVFLLFKEDDHDKVEISNGSSVRIKTLRDSPIVESLVIRDEASVTTKNFVGDERVGCTWTDKVMKVKSLAEEKKDNQDNAEIDEDEWND